MKHLHGRFGHLTVIGEDRSSRYRRLVCKCDCGQITLVLPSNLGRTTNSCGCLKRRRLRTHGQSKTRLYHIWTMMLQRCKNPKNGKFKIYGGRGIRVCKGWHDFAVFLSWAKANGYKDNLSIDRRYSNRGYSPSNCRWVTAAEQSFNRRKAEGKSSSYLGVNWHSQSCKWRARITYKGRQLEIGLFKSEREAARARDVKAVELHGEFAKLNFPRRERAP